MQVKKKIDIPLTLGLSAKENELKKCGISWLSSLD
jgi:hypothetical protein